MNEEINIDEIMTKIKENIKKRGYSDDLLDFNDITITEGNAIDDVELNSKYKQKLLEQYIDYSIIYCRETPVAPSNNKIKYFIKKVFRKIKKIIRFRNRQEDFDLYVAKSLNQLKGFVRQQDKYLVPEHSHLMTKSEEWEFYSNQEKMIEQLQNRISLLEEEIVKLKGQK